jgi:hypothetical protein
VCHEAGLHPRGHSDPTEMANSSLATRGRSRGGGAPTNSAGDDHGSDGWVAVELRGTTADQGMATTRPEMTSCNLTAREGGRCRAARPVRQRQRGALGAGGMQRGRGRKRGARFS